MKPFGANKILGLSVGERGVLCCEVARAAGGPRAERMAEFTFPPGVSTDDPTPAGEALGRFLKEQKFSARRTVIGVPLRWAVIKPKDVPPVAPAALDDLLRLQAERDFALESHDLVYEYAGESSAAAARTVLLMAVQRKRVDSVVALARAAGLTVEAVTLSSVALAEETSRLTGGEGAVLHVTSGSAELAVQHAGHPRVLRHLRMPAPSASPAGGAAPTGATAVGDGNGPGPGGADDGPVPLGQELRQVLSLMPQNGTAPELVLWDGIGLGDAPRRWGESLGRTVKEQSLTDLGVTGGVDAAGPSGRYAAAVALALAPLRGEAVAPNLVRPRLAPKKQRRVGRPLVWGVAVAATVALLIAAALYDLSANRGEAAELRQQLKDSQEDVKAAQASIARTTFAQGWTDTQPRFLECLYDLTNAFPGDGRAWAINLTTQADGKGTATCRAADRPTALGLLDRLRDTGRFTDVTLINLQEASRGSQEVTVTLSFRYAAAAPPAPTTGTAGVGPAGAASTPPGASSQPAVRPRGS